MVKPFEICFLGFLGIGIVEKSENYMLKKLLLKLLILSFVGCYYAERNFLDITTPSGAALHSLLHELKLANQKEDSELSQVDTPPVSLPTVDTLVFSPSPGVITSLSNISISTSTSGSTIHYTTDGTNPTTSSSQYTSPLENVWFLAGKTIKAFAVKSEMLDSNIATGVFSYPPLKTGQTSSYSSGDDDTHQSGVSRSYSDNGDGTITDKATGLVWQKCSMGQWL